MDEILKTGQIVRTEISRMNCEIEAFLGGGGQGEVYRAKLDGKDVAVKWYYPDSATSKQRTVLETLIMKGAPNDKFLWPIELASADNVPDFGYIMPLREERYKSLFDLMKRRIDPTFYALATAGLYLSHSFLQLHSQGCCYRDISFGNVFFDPENGDILICDIDNITVDDATFKSDIIGTLGFMAPEVLCGDEHPSTKTDLFSLAVLLFYIFMMNHPLAGQREADIRCLDQAALTKLYGEEPLFIFDPNDHSNAPVKGYQDTPLLYWPIYPQFLRDLFTKAFTDGIKDPLNGRIREGQWRAAMVRLRDSILYCSSCNAENFYDSDALRQSGSKLKPCWSCKRDITLPFRIRIDNNVVMLNHDTKLYPHHIDEERMYDFSRLVAEVNRHPTNPNLWGLKNLTSEKWSSTKSDGTVQDIYPGKSVPLISGTKILFGSKQGEIRY
jgi:eukaryotic-like serine/threonine-protein kinase